MCRGSFFICGSTHFPPLKIEAAHPIIPPPLTATTGTPAYGKKGWIRLIYFCAAFFERFFYKMGLHY